MRVTPAGRYVWVPACAVMPEAALRNSASFLALTEQIAVPA